MTKSNIKTTPDKRRESAPIAIIGCDGCDTTGAISSCPIHGKPPHTYEPEEAPYDLTEEDWKEHHRKIISLP